MFGRLAFAGRLADRDKIAGLIFRDLTDRDAVTVNLLTKMRDVKRFPTIPNDLTKVSVVLGCTDREGALYLKPEPRRSAS
jgi:hypothetical protein